MKNYEKIRRIGLLVRIRVRTFISCRLCTCYNWAETWQLALRYAFLSKHNSVQSAGFCLFLCRITWGKCAWHLHLKGTSIFAFCAYVQQSYAFGHVGLCMYIYKFMKKISCRNQKDFLQKSKRKSKRFLTEIKKISYRNQKDVGMDGWSYWQTKFTYKEWKYYWLTKCI